MARNYNQYASSDNDNSGSDSDGDSGGKDYPEDKNLTLTPYAEIQGALVKVFGNENFYGHSLGISWEDVQLTNGCLYHDPDKDNYKIFSWKAVVGMDPGEGDFDAGDANKFLMKTYGSTEKRYELVEAVHPDKDDPVEIGNAVMWYSGSNAHGPKSASKTLSKILTDKGRDMFVEEDDWYDGLSASDQKLADLDPTHEDHLSWITGWLSDTSNENRLRSDLEGRRFNFFEVKKDSNNSDRKYHHPIVEDAQTETLVAMDNDASDSSGEKASSETSGTLDGSGEGETATATDGGQSRREELEAMDYSDLQSLGSETEGATGSGSTEDIIQGILDAEDGVPAAQTQSGVPEAITDFVSSVGQFSDFTRDRAETLLEDFITDDGLPLTQDLVDDFGGNDAVLAEAGY